MFELTTSAPPNKSGEQPKVNEWVNFGRTLYRRRAAFAIIFGVFFASVLILTLVMPKKYSAGVRLIAGSSAAEASSSAGTDIPILNALQVRSSVQTVETYAALIMQPAVAQDVIDTLKLNTTPDVVLGAMTVKPVTNTSILDITVSWRKPEEAARIANAVAEAFVRHERELTTASATAALNFVGRELPAAETKMHDAQSELARYQSTHHIADIAQQTQSTLANMATLDAKIASTEVEVRQNQAQLASATGMLAREKTTTANGGSVSQNPVFAQLNSQLATAQVQLQTAEQQYTDLHPTVIALREQVAQLRNRIAQTPQTIVAASNTAANPVYQQLSEQAANARGAIAAAQASIATMRKQRADMEPGLRELPEQTNRLMELKSRAQAASDVVTALQKKATDATVSRSSTISDVTIVAPADASTASVKPNLKTNLVIGLVVGLLLGLSGALLMDYLDNSIKDENDVVTELALPILASIPRVESKGKFALPWIRSLTVEAFLQLVTSLRYASDRPIRTLALTSPLQGDGKSSIAMNVAITLAEIHPRILLIDGDLRRPSLHTKFSMRNDAGLSDVIVGNATLGESIRQTRHAGLDLLTSGMRTPSPLRLLESDRFEQLLEDALETYRMVIIDGPALGPVIDGAVLCKKADGAVLVVSAGMTDMRSTKSAIARLQSLGVNDLLGVIVNRTEPNRRDYDDSYLGTQETKISLPS